VLCHGVDFVPLTLNCTRPTSIRSTVDLWSRCVTCLTPVIPTGHNDHHVSSQYSIQDPVHTQHTSNYTFNAPSASPQGVSAPGPMALPHHSPPTSIPYFGISGPTFDWNTVQSWIAHTQFLHQIEDFQQIQTASFANVSASNVSELIDFPTDLEQELAGLFEYNFDQVDEQRPQLMNFL